MRKIQLEQDFIVELYLGKKSVVNIAKQFSVSKSTIHRILSRAGVPKTKPTDLRKHTFNECYFDKINNSIKAYWLGFLYADGCVRRRSNTLTINLARKDANHLCRFVQDIGGSHEVRQFNKGESELSSITISSAQFTSQLKLKGIESHKKRVYMLEDDELERCYWRGVFDGDGCVRINYAKRKRKQPKPYLAIKLVGSKHTAVKFRSFCRKYILTKAQIRPCKKSIAYYFSLHGNGAVKIADLLYDGDGPRLHRKENQIIEFKSL